MPLDILIADDHAIVRSGLSRLLKLETQYQVVGSVGSAEDLIAHCQKKVPDLVILDLSMPGMGGVEAIRRLLSKWPKLKIVTFSIYQNPRLVKRILEMGGQGYISKNTESDIIIKGINTVFSGKKFVSPDIELKLISPEPLSDISAREFDIFRCVAEGLSTSQISEKLCLSEKTIANYISIIKKKINVSSTTEMVHVALREGLIYPENI